MRRLEPAAMPMCLSAGWRFFFWFRAGGLIVDRMVPRNRRNSAVEVFFLGGHNIRLVPFWYYVVGIMLLIIFGSE